MMYLSLGKKSTKEFTVKHSFLNLSDKPEQFHKLLSSEEIVVLLVQSKYGSNSNVSVGYKIEAGIKSLSKKSSNVFKFAKVQSEDILQDPTRKNSKVEYGKLLSNSLKDGIPCLLIFQWGLKSIRSAIPLSSSTLRQLVRRKTKRYIRKNINEVLTSFVPMSSTLKIWNNNNNNPLKWIRKNKKQTRVLFYDNISNEPPPWYKRLSLLFDDGRVRFGWINSKMKGGNDKAVASIKVRWAPLSPSTSSTNDTTSATKSKILPIQTMMPNMLQKQLLDNVDTINVPRIRTKKEFVSLCQTSCVLGIFEFGDKRGGNEVLALRELASKTFARVAYSEKSLLDMKVERAPIHFGWIMASQQERLLTELNIFRTPCLLSVNRKSKKYTVHQNRIPMNVDLMYSFIRKLFSGQHKVTTWRGNKNGGSFETLFDIEQDDNEPQDIKVWYDTSLPGYNVDIGSDSFSEKNNNDL